MKFLSFSKGGKSLKESRLAVGGHVHREVVLFQSFFEIEGKSPLIFDH